ncbi:hypothetical protein AYL99_01564 [Fonsecaea erecta]|uniref:C3H1-type domain-containing protein n=1 Tax=Fonsecaea erecta TaxID=1367422 RepID=A0A179A0S8_9EURO|nr:hypothetical protein AYL99_01564 [Fonsecaea erecta]OAP65592.1 hypothetical protein AYL99_01564 [Fonsecaea erecta]
MAVQQSLKPQYFVTRQNGALVPLVAMDELPIHVQIEGVSRSLSVFETAGMTSVGVCESRHEFYVISSMNNTRSIPSPPACALQTPVSKVSAPTSIVKTPVLRPTTPSGPSPPKTPNVAENQPSETSSNTVPSSAESNEGEDKSTRPSTQSPSPRPNAGPHGILPANTTTFTPLAWRSTAASLTAASNTTAPPADPVPEMPPTGQKVYCSYWLRNGECNFAQQGCMYKHVMPMKLEVLEALGFRDLPDWYRKTYNVGSLRVNGGRNGLSYGILDGNKPAPRFAESTKNMLASHITPLPTVNGRGGVQAYRPADNNRHPRAAGNHHHYRGRGTGNQRGPAHAAKAWANARERRDECLAAAFAADMDSELGDMMDAQMEKIREREQAGWEEEQEAARKAAAEADKHGEKSNETENGSKEGEKDKNTPVAAAAAPAVVKDEQKPRHAAQHKADHKQDKGQRLEKLAQSKAQRQSRKKT